MKINIPARLGLFGTALLSLTMLTGANGDGGCGTGLDNRPGVPGIDVGGDSGADWQVSYGTTLEVVVKGGAGTVISRSNIVVTTGGSFVIDGIMVDLKAMCQRNEVACPQDVFPATVRMTQPGKDLHFMYLTFNPKGPLGAAGQATLVGNVGSDDAFAIALDVGGAVAGTCGLLKVSYANGHIQPDPQNLQRGISLTGEIVTEYTGGCVTAGKGQTAGAGLSVEFHLPLSALRKG